MSIALFKPNKSNTGSLGIFRIAFLSSEENGTNGEIALFYRNVKQVSWTGRTGSFGENFKIAGKNINVKFNEFELGGILNSLKRRVEYRGFHTSQGGSTLNFSFSPHVDQQTNKVAGFYLHVNQRDAKFSIPITFGEAENIMALLDYGLKTLYANRTRNAAAKDQAYQESRQPQPAPSRLSMPSKEDDFAEQSIVNEDEQGSNGGDGDAGDGSEQETDPNPFA